jgi:predicted CXXCH cytochrome family protein
MLLAEKRQLCGECHDDIVELAEEARVDHASTLTGEECLHCHSPHAADNESNLREPQLKLCLGCHDEPVEFNGSKLANIKSLLDRNPEWHDPIREEGCTVCHQPMGGEIFRLLTKAFPAKFYASFGLEKYALCFSCHEQTLVTSKQTRSLTGFRDGSRNLHSLHVNKRRRGRTCRACHEMHASKNSFQIREKSRFGKWMMPINFRERETGGSCQPGCHRREAYDRQER